MSRIYLEYSCPFLLHCTRSSLGARISQSVKTVCLCLKTSYFLFYAGVRIALAGCWQKLSSGEKIYQWKSLRNVWVVWLPRRVAVSQSISRAAENYPGFPPPQGSRTKCVFRSRIAWFDVDSVVLSSETVHIRLTCRPSYRFAKQFQK